MATRGEERFEEVAALHRRTVDAVAATVEAIGDDAWSAPMAAGKWSPGIVVEHLVTTYGVLLRELDGGAGMAVKTRAWQRLLLRLTMVPRILGGKGFPEGARAPRETRPPASARPRAEALAAFRDAAARLEEAMSKTQREAPRKRLTHAYFGAAPFVDSYLLCTRHLEHHHRQLAAVAAAPPAVVAS